MSTVLVLFDCKVKNELSIAANDADIQQCARQFVLKRIR